MTKEELRELIHSYLWRINYLNNYFGLFAHIRKEIAASRESIWVAPMFFQTTIDALYHTVVVELAKLYSKYDDGLNKLLNICEHNKDLFRTEGTREWKNPQTMEIIDREEYKVCVLDDIRVQREEIEKRKESIERIKVWRDKYFAHLDKEYRRAPEKLSEQYPLSDQVLRDLIDLADHICNQMLFDLNDECFGIDSTYVLDVDELLAIVDRHVQQEDKEFEEILSKDGEEN